MRWSTRTCTALRTATSSPTTSCCPRGARSWSTWGSRARPPAFVGAGGGRPGARRPRYTGGMRRIGPPAVLLLCACHPQARRLLVLDLALSEPALLNGTVQPWRDEGYHIEYRRFYPHLARADLDRYRVLLFLLGREPEAPSDALTVGDLALLTEWVLRGGVAVLGYDADGEGYLDRWTTNRWLDFLGTGISIGDRLLEDTTTRALTTTGRPQPWAEARTVGDEPLGSPLGEVYEPFPLDRNNVITVRDHSALLAVTSLHAFVRAPRPPRAPSPRGGAGVVAAARVGDGLVLVISRHALGALGPQFRPTTAPPPQPAALERTRGLLTALARRPRRPAARARWGEGGAVGRAWGAGGGRLEPTSVAWIPVLDYDHARRNPADSSRGARGEGLAAPCALDSALWAEGLSGAYAALGRLAAEQRTLVIALGLDIEGPRGHSMGQEFCDAAWRRAIAGFGNRAELDSLPSRTRYAALRDAGLLSRYYRALEDEVAGRAAALRDRILKERRDLYFAFRLPQAPADWFALGLLRGFALPGRPLLLFTPELRTRQLLALYRSGGLNLAHAVAVPPAALAARDWTSLKRLVFEENDGFWLAPDEAPGLGKRVSLDSLGRLLRRLAR